MFLYAMLAAVVGSILTAVGKTTNSATFSLSGGLMCLVSGIMFLVIAFD